MLNLEIFLQWLFLFFLFNVMGWCIESTVESISHKRPINRGFLAGPYIPIFGVGGVLFALIGIPLREAFDNIFVNIFLVFFVGMSLATLLEYMVGGLLERLFKKRFWDYSKLKLTNKYHYNNRISLIASVFWGVLSLFMSFVLYDIVSAFVQSLSFDLIVIVCFIMAFTMLLDTVIQVRRYGHIREFLEKMPHEQLKEAILKHLLRTGTRQQIREFRNAFYQNIKENVEAIKENVKENVETIKENVKENVETIKENAKENLVSFKEKLLPNNESENADDKEPEPEPDSI